uniref:RNA polymerase n=1 Tax=Pseudomonas phage Arace01 TaxID=3138526 RepID=A0AAU6VZJ4_9VIRU
MSDLNLHAHQRELEKLYNKNQVGSRIKAQFIECKEFDFIGYMESKDIPRDFGLDLLVQMALHKRCSLPTLVGIMLKHTDSPQEATDLLYQAAAADLINWSPDLKIFIVQFTISADVQEEIDRFQFPLPMVVPPAKLKHNLQTGYLTSGGSIILKNNHHSDDVCLDHLNRMNRIKFTINHDVVRLVKNEWRNLDKPKDGESREDFDRRKRAFEKYDRTARDVMDTICKHSDEFYLTHRPDKRGRTYCQGYHVNYQGAAWNKAVVQFANKELVE